MNEKFPIDKFVTDGPGEILSRHSKEMLVQISVNFWIFLFSNCYLFIEFSHIVLKISWMYLRRENVVTEFSLQFSDEQFILCFFFHCICNLLSDIQ